MPPRGVVLFLGDSMTMGSGVNDGEEYPDLIRRRLDEAFGSGAVPVVNAAVGHNGNGRWIKFLRNEAERYEPRFVILQCHANDLFENVQERLFAVDESSELIELPVPPRGRMGKWQAVVESIPGVRSSYLMAMVRQAVARRFRRRDASAAPEEAARQERLTFRIIEEALEICRQRGWPVIAMSTEADAWVYRDGQLDRLRAVFDTFGVPLIQMPSKRERPELYYADDPHWHAGGHKWVADLLYEQLLADARFERPSEP